MIGIDVKVIKRVRIKLQNHYFSFFLLTRFLVDCSNKKVHWMWTLNLFKSMMNRFDQKYANSKRGYTKLCTEFGLNRINKSLALVFTFEWSRHARNFSRSLTWNWGETEDIFRPFEISCHCIEQQGIEWRKRSWGFISPNRFVYSKIFMKTSE